MEDQIMKEQLINRIIEQDDFYQGAEQTLKLMGVTDLSRLLLKIEQGNSITQQADII